MRESRHNMEWRVAGRRRRSALLYGVAASVTLLEIAGMATLFSKGAIPVEDIRSFSAGGPGAWMMIAGVALAALVPGVRLGFMSLRWLRMRDYRFALIAGAVLAILVAGAALRS